jgi:hypothetical protein
MAQPLVQTAQPFQHGVGKLTPEGFCGFSEVGKLAGSKPIEAMKKIARGRGFETAMDGPIMLLVPSKMT